VTTTFFVRAPSITVLCLIVPCISKAVPVHLKKLFAFPRLNFAVSSVVSTPKKAPDVVLD
jgi:hypothetical protein